ncbi:MerC domain-containing protein [Coralloluteibacterium thermophilus]|uniref:MerC domain-containing protein n=1 Tax=Coralloluteibacterium thermophilum TaxID=2707049 RepID=A0ABV9NJ77_9GAMM
MRWTPWLDRLGAATSAACGVHCAALSAFLLMNPAIWFQRARYAREIQWLTWLEIGFAAAAVLFAVLALGSGWRRHRHWLPTALALPGLSMILAGVFTRLHDVLFWGAGTVLAGGLLMIAAHGVNVRLGKREREEGIGKRDLKVGT